MATIFATAPEFLLVCGVLVFAQAVYVMFGFGSGLIAVGSLAMFMPNIQDVVVLLLLINLPAELYVVLSNRMVISWRAVLLICGGVVVGVPVGTRILQYGQPLFVLTLLGVFLVLVGGVFVALPQIRARRFPRWTGPPVGVFAGVLGGLFGTGGPPLILYYQLQGVDKAAFRGNLMAIFLLVGVVRIPIYGLSGLITVPRLYSCLAVFPAVLLGTWIGHRVQLRLSEATFRRGVSVALIVIGAALLIRQIS